MGEITWVCKNCGEVAKTEYGNLPPESGCKNNILGLHDWHPVAAQKCDEIKLQNFVDWLNRRKLNPCKNPDEVLTMTKKKFADDFDREIDDIIEKFERMFTKKT